MVDITVQTIQNADNIKDCKVQLFMSKNAMLGLGKELIRAAHEKGVGDITHFYPSTSHPGYSQTLGVIVHPESVEPILGDDEFETIDNIILDSNE